MPKDYFIFIHQDAEETHRIVMNRYFYLTYYNPAQFIEVDLMRFQLCPHCKEDEKLGSNRECPNWWGVIRGVPYSHTVHKYDPNIQMYGTFPY